MKNLSRKEIIILASTLFGMFFGAGNLIFPVHLGQLAGRNVVLAIIGFVVTAVSIPILGVAAIGITHSSGLFDLANKVSKKYAYIFTCLLYLTIGPFFAIPRCAATSFTIGVSSLWTNVERGFLLLIFSLVFFALVLYFSLRPQKITTWIGKWINPLFLVFFSILLFSAFLQIDVPLSSIEPTEAYTTKAFFNGFVEGYGTMDAIAGLAFGILVVNIVRDYGIEDKNEISKSILHAGIYTAVLMSLIYILSILLGVKSRSVFEISSNGGIALGQLANRYLGNAGSLVLTLTITLACLKTAIGLVTSCAVAFREMFPNSLSYRNWVIVFCVFSFLVSNVGLTTLMSFSLPVLLFLYPLTITLIILSLTGRFFNDDPFVYKAVTYVCAVMASLDIVKGLPLGLEGIIAFIERIVPFYGLGLGWVLPSLIAFIIALAYRKKIVKEK